MKMFMRMFKKNRTILLALFAGTLTLSAMGCGYYACNPPPVWAASETPAELQNNYIHILESEGVQVIEEGETFTLVFPSDQVFIFDSNKIDSDYEPVLNTAIDLMRTFSLINVEVAGYTDNTVRHYGVRDKNLLTTMQAQAVSNYLWDVGANARLVYAIGYGAKDPVSNNAFSRGRALNRRIEVSFQYYPKTNTFF